MYTKPLVDNLFKKQVHIIFLDIKETFMFTASNQIVHCKVILNSVNKYTTTTTTTTTIF